MGASIRRCERRTPRREPPRTRRQSPRLYSGLLGAKRRLAMMFEAGGDVRKPRMSAREWIKALASTSASTALASALALLFVLDASAGEGGINLIATTRDTNLRKLPTADSEILTLIRKGAMVAVADCRTEWCRVSWNGRDGYVIARNLGTAQARGGPAAPVPAWPGPDYGATRGFTKINTPAWRQESSNKEGSHEPGGYDHAFILEIGAAGEWPLASEPANFGGTIAGEVEPIENWLELEFGFTTLATAGHTEVSADILFKKPFRLSPTVEFMAGAGPSLTRTLNGPEQGNAWSVEFALDWMFWPTENLGWYIEPTWSVNPRNGQQSAAVSIGILIGFPK